MRALELLEQGALRPPDGPSRLWTADTRHPTRLVGLVRDRDELYARIEARVDAMVAAGVADEVRARRRGRRVGRPRASRSASTSCCAATSTAMKRRTRHFARRQLTWLRKLPDVELVDADAAATAGARSRPP